MDLVTLIFGICCVVLSIIPFVNNLAFFLAIIPIVLSVICLIQNRKHSDKYRKKFVLGGLITGILAIILTLGSQALYGAAIDSAIDNVTPEQITATDVSDAKSEDAPELVEEILVEPTTEYDSYYIEGKISNTTDKDIVYLDITYTLFDADGNKIDTTSDYCFDGLKAGETWAFSAMVLDKDFASYKLDNIEYNFA